MKAIYYFLKYNRYLKKALKRESLVDKLKFLFGGREFKTDWISRIWTVINPNIDNINTGGNTLIYGEEEVIIEKWLMDNLNIMSKFITTNNLFDIMTYKIKKLDNDDNYLIIFQNIYYDDFKKSIKWILGILGILGIIGIITLIIL